MDIETPPSATIPSEHEPRRGIPIAWVHLGVVFTALCMVPFAKTVDSDFWWHLRTGKLIMQSGVPRHDPFSWTASGDDWVVHEWLSETIIYGVESTVGYAGNVLLFGIATVAALLLMYALSRRLGVGTTPLVLLSVLAAVVLVRFVTVRPQVFTWFFVAIFVYTLQRHDEGDDVRLWVLPPLMAVWGKPPASCSTRAQALIPSDRKVRTPTPSTCLRTADSLWSRIWGWTRFSSTNLIQTPENYAPVDNLASM